MRFTAEHEFAAPAAAVGALLCDASFHTTLDLPDLSRPTVVADETHGAQRVLRLRYAFVGHLDPIAHRVLAGRELTWIQELQLDLNTLTGRLSFAAEAEPNRLHGSATVAVSEMAGTTRRVINGEFHVKVPLIGGSVERRLVPGIVRRLGVEADAVNRRLRSP